jgi:hypothetical protein
MQNGSLNSVLLPLRKTQLLPITLLLDLLLRNDSLILVDGRDRVHELDPVPGVLGRAPDLARNALKGSRDDQINQHLRPDADLRMAGRLLGRDPFFQLRLGQAVANDLCGLRLGGWFIGLHLEPPALWARLVPAQPD